MTGITNNYNAVPEPLADVESLRQAVRALKETVEILTRQRQPVTAACVTWQDLVDLKLIPKTKLPTR